MTYHIDLSVACYIGHAFPDLAYRAYENFAMYCNMWMKGELNVLTTKEQAQYCDVEGREHLLGVFQNFLDETDAKVEKGELSCSNVSVYECLLAIRIWLDS